MKSPHNELSRRERQIMDVLFRMEQATVSDVQTAMPDPPSYSAVRAMLRILEDKGHVRHEQDGPRYLYKPALARERAKKSAMRHLLHTFFAGSHEQAVAALLDEASSTLSDAEFDRLARLIDRRRTKDGAGR